MAGNQHPAGDHRAHRAHRAGGARRWVRLGVRLLAGVLLPVTVAAACGQPTPDRGTAAGGSTGVEVTPATTGPSPTGGTGTDRPAGSDTGAAAGPGALPAGELTAGELTAEEVKQAPALPPAVDLEELASQAARTVEVQPVAISIDAIDLDQVTVQAVGVEAGGEMSIPPPREVGWYRYGPEPGEAGSAVLAGHVASGGVNGAFRHLDRLEPGDRVDVTMSDGRRLGFVVSQRVQVGKAELPFDELFARSGPPKLALITCGGEFDYSARSYRDNIVVVAELAP